MSDAFQGGFGAFIRPKEYGIVAKLPDIPLWVPERSAAALQGLITRTVRLALQDIAGFISDEAAKSTDTGALAQSFGANPATSTGGIEVLNAAARRDGGDVLGRVFSALPYAIVVNQGRRAGSPISRAGIEAIGLWAQRKLGLSGEQATRAKWAIAMNIVRYGTEGTDYFEHGVDRGRPRVEQMFQILGQQIGAAMVKVGGEGQTGTA